MKISCLGFNATELTIEKGSGNIVVKLQRSNIFLKELIVNACIESRCTRGCCCCCCRCITTTTCVQTIPTIEEKKSASSDQGFDFTIYPNPSSGRIKIKSTYTDFSLEIFDINGRLVYSVKELTDELEQNLDFSCPERM
ncbi:MAG: T9SS type A sorting domain-containing protein [Bacteroidetes bacterium]|nr:T9SS type A sorting domain-containing protein [Bacteroidota bacterium]